MALPTMLLGLVGSRLMALSKMITLVWPLKVEEAERLLVYFNKLHEDIEKGLWVWMLGKVTTPLHWLPLFHLPRQLNLSRTTLLLIVSCPGTLKRVWCNLEGIKTQCQQPCHLCSCQKLFYHSNQSLVSSTTIPIIIKMFFKVSLFWGSQS